MTTGAGAGFTGKIFANALFKILHQCTFTLFTVLKQRGFAFITKEFDSFNEAIFV